MRRLLPALLVVLVLGACSDDGDPSDAPAPGAGSSGETSAELESVVADVQRLAPELESLFRGTVYPTTIEGAVAGLAEIDDQPSPGNTVGGYVYDDSDVEFTLCIEGPTGAYATYDTSPMSVQKAGETGGCPAG